MENNTQEVESVVVEEVIQAEIRRTPVLSEYMELLKTKDEAACMSYLKECFGAPTSPDMDKEGFDAFVKEVTNGLNTADTSNDYQEDKVDDTASAE